MVIASKIWLIPFLFICGYVLIGCNHTKQRSDVENHSFQKLNEYMAEMEVHFSYLTLHLGDSNEWDNCKEKVDLLIQYLSESKTYSPTVLMELPKLKQKQMIELYQHHTEKMLNLLIELRVSVHKKHYPNSKKLLDAVDQRRRDCHVLFG